MKLLFLAAVFSGLITTASNAETRVLVYGDSNTYGWVPTEAGFPTDRYADAVRWPGVLETVLGNGATVIVDGLSGRTVNSAYPEPLNGIDGTDFMGLPHLDETLAKELPLDLVIIMLGTNDGRSDFTVTPEQVAMDVGAMVVRAQNINGGVFTTYPAPEVLVVAPPAMGDTSRTPISGVTQGSDKKTAAIAQAIIAQGKAAGFRVFDANSIISIETIDGIHFSPEDHAKLGAALAVEVKNILAQK
jgi:lysophospholipase L1-like esterase